MILTDIYKIMYLTKKKIQDAFVKFTWTDFTTILKLVKMLRKLHLSVNPSFNFSTLLFFFKQTISVHKGRITLPESNQISIETVVCKA